MKQLLLNFNCKFFLPLVLMFGLSSISYGQNTITISTANCTATADEFRFDVLVTNNGPQAIQFNGTAIRLTHSAAILAGGTNTIVFSFVNDGLSDFPLVWPPSSAPTFTYTAATRLFGVSTSTGVYLNGAGCAAPNIPIAATRKIGRFSIKNNAQNFVPGADVGLVWNTSTAVTAYVNCALGTTGFNTAGGNRTLAAPCTLFIPAGCTSPTVNSNPSDQSVCTSGTATFTGSFLGGSPVPTTIWQVQTGGVGLFTDLTETAPYSGTATGTLTITNPNLSLSTNRYRIRANNTCGDVFTNSALLTVNPNVTAGTVSGTSPLCIGATPTYSSTGTGGGSWSSTFPLIASVNPVSGLVTALAAGTTDITYTVNSGCGSPVSAFQSLTVSPNANTGTVSGTSPICISNTTAYTSNGDPGGVWSSTNTAVATVNAGGVVTAVAAGTADIRYTISTGCAAFSFKTITVTPFTALAGTTGGVQVCSNTTVLAGGSSFSDGSCNLIAKVVPSGGATAVSGSINTCVRVEDVVHTYQSAPYVQRVYDIEPATNAATATATITLYYTQAEFTAYNLARGAYLAIPASSGDVGNIPNIRLTQYHGTGTYPGNYTGPQVPELIDPVDANVVWNPAGAGRWEITFNVIGFSGFYLSSKPIVLPVSLLNFSGRNNGSANLLEWTTSSEQNSNYFNLQRSTDGINYVNAGTIAASGNSSTAKNYNYSDNITAINTTLFYYRLKIVDITGSIKYSPVVKIKLNSKGFNIEATNPFADQLKINIETELSEKAVISLKDISGRKLQQTESQLRKGNNALLLTNLGHIPGGVYLLTITTDSQQQTVKVVKQ